jgi:sugar O-acyltransferase (sialic acid O-acetyltransferase NeuD family)
VKGRLILVGAGDFAREVIWMISDMGDSPEWELAGLLDDDIERATTVVRSSGFGHPILGTIVDFLPGASDRFVCTIAKPKIKLTLCERIAARGGQFVNLIHPTAAIGPGCTLGRGIIVCRNAVCTTNVTIADHVHINLATTCGHDVAIGEGCTLSGHCDVTGRAILERGVFLASHASIGPGVRVGAFAVVGAGSVAFRNVPNGQTLLGVPGKSLLS